MEWPVEKLTSLCVTFTDGDWVESKDQSLEGVRLIQTGNVGEGAFKDRRDKSRFISIDTFNRLKCTEIFEGDCLVSRLPDPVGRACLIPKTNDRMITAVDCTIIRLNRSQLLPELFCYFTQSSSYLAAVESLTSGATRKRISRKNLGELPIPLPPIPEQQRIVAILDQAFAGIEKARGNAEKNLKNARELFDSYLHRVFSERGEGWVEETLDEIVEIGCSLSYGIVQPGDDFSDGLPVVRPTDLKSKIIDTKGLKLIRPELANAYRRTTLEGGELLLCVRGSTGVISIASQELAGANVTRGIVPIRFDKSIMMQTFGYYQFISEKIQRQVKAHTYGAALMQINIRDLRKLIFLIPPINFQSAAIQRLDEIAQNIERLESVYQEKINSLDELKKSLLQKAFSGELTKSKGIAA